MNGIDAVVIATGNDWRAVEAGAHAFAARSGRYSRSASGASGENGNLVGFIELPLALGIVGGTLAHARGRGPRPQDQRRELRPGAGDARRVRRAWRRTSRRCARSPPTASSAATWRCTRAGGDRGRRDGDEVERVAEEIHAAGHVTLDAALAALGRLRRAARAADITVVDVAE